MGLPYTERYQTIPNEQNGFLYQRDGQAACPLSDTQRHRGFPARTTQLRHKQRHKIPRVVAFANGDLLHNESSGQARSISGLPESPLRVVQADSFESAWPRSLALRIFPSLTDRRCSVCRSLQMIHNGENACDDNSRSMNFRACSFSATTVSRLYPKTVGSVSGTVTIRE
jgi:hypothetical protein